MSAVDNKQQCPDPSSLERWYLTTGRPRNDLHGHIKGCPRCRNRMVQIEIFYRILMKELADGPDPAALDLSKHFAPKTTTYGLLICVPLPGRNDRRGKAYLASMAFSANGNGSTTRLADYPLQPKHIGIMVYTDVANAEQILIARSKDENLANWQMSIPGIGGPLILNGAASVRLPLMGLEALHNHLFFFKNIRKQPRAVSVVGQIRSSLSL